MRHHLGRLVHAERHALGLEERALLDVRVVQQPLAQLAPSYHTMQTQKGVRVGHGDVGRAPELTRLTRRESSSNSSL